MLSSSCHTPSPSPFLGQTSSNPTLASVTAVFAAGAVYAYFLRKRRGHLVHVLCTKT